MKTVNRRLPLWTALLAVFALVASGCGGEGGTETGTETGTSTEAGTVVATGDPETGTAGTGATETEGTQASGESCYEGETATFVVSYKAGGGYDNIARAASPYLEDELGGTVIVENQPGAGGLLAMRSLQSAEGNPLRFGFFTGQGMAGSVIGGAEGADFDLMDFSFVGRVAADQRVLAVPGNSSELQTIEDVRDAQQLRYATAGPGANDYIDAVVLNDILEPEIEIITGFDGSAETELAVTTGDVDLASGTVGSRLGAIESGDHRAVLVLSDESSDDLPDVPTLTSLDLPEDKMGLAENYINLQRMGRMVWAPPGVPEDCLTELTDAFEAVMENPEFVEQIEAMDQEIDWRSGEEMRETAQSILDAPEEFQSLLQQAYQGS